MLSTTRLTATQIEAAAREDVDHPWYQRLDVPLVVGVGRLVLQKGFDVLIAAADSCHRRGHRLRLVIIGEGSESRALESQIAGCSQPESISLLGYQSNPYKLMARATVFVLSSRFEGFPNALVEAMACGLPVVATNCPSGPGEIITHEHDGLLVPVDDVGALADGILRFMRDDGLRRRCSHAGAARIRSLTPDAIARRYEEVLFEGE